MISDAPKHPLHRHLHSTHCLVVALHFRRELAILGLPRGKQVLRKGKAEYHHKKHAAATVVKDQTGITWWNHGAFLQMVQQD